MSPELLLAIDAAREVGDVLKDNYEKDIKVSKLSDYDIKINLDLKCQKIIENKILSKFPDHSIYGEEGIAGNLDSDIEWIIDPIDGTVNFFYGIPHFCISIAMRKKGDIKIGVIYDPIRNEMFTADYEGKSKLNDKVISTSNRKKLIDSIIVVGFSKEKESIDLGIKKYAKILPLVKKTRMMGSAALALAYIACGRLDAYIEDLISIWDIAAGKVILEKAGGSIILNNKISKDKDKIGIISTNGKISVDSII